MLVKKIRNKEINPKTNEIFKIQDIIIEGYKTAVEEKLNMLVNI